MFESFDRSKKFKRRKEFMFPAVGIVVASLAVVQVRSDWNVTALPLPPSSIDVDIIPQTLAPPPPPKGGAKRPTPKVPTVTKIKVDRPVQPILDKPKDEPKQEAAEDNGDPDGVEGGVEGGVAGGVVGGVLGGTGMGMEPPPGFPTQQNVIPTVFKANRISGNEQIQPDDMTKLEISRSGKSRLILSVKLCVDVAGNVEKTQKLGTTGFPAYDAKLLSEVKKWRYRPFMLNGKAVPTCSTVQFIYSQR